MKKIILLFLLAILFSFKTKLANNINQKKNDVVNYIPYYLKVYEADSLYLTNNFQKSYKILDSLFKKFQPKNSDTFSEYGVYLNSAVMSNNLENIKEKVRFGYLNFGDISTLHIDSYEMFLKVNNLSGLTKENIAELKKTYFSKLNLDLRKKLLDMYIQDQEIRQSNLDLSTIDSIDKSISTKLDNILNNYGFPNNSLIGQNNAFDSSNDGQLSLNILFIHQPNKIKKKVLPLISENIKKGLSEPKLYSEIYDRMIMDSINKQYFGTYTCDNNDKLCDLINPTKLDSIRKSIGLPNVKYHSWRMKQLGH